MVALYCDPDSNRNSFPDLLLVIIREDTIPGTPFGLAGRTRYWLMTGRRAKIRPTQRQLLSLQHESRAQMGICWLFVIEQLHDPPSICAGSIETATLCCPKSVFVGNALRTLDTMILGERSATRNICRDFPNGRNVTGWYRMPHPTSELVPYSLLSFTSLTST